MGVEPRTTSRIERIATALLSWMRFGLLLKILAGIGLGTAALLVAEELRSSRIVYFLMLLLTYGGIALVLALVGRSSAAKHLATLLAIMAAPYTDAVVVRAAASVDLAALLVLSKPLQFNAFGATALWLFVASFPREASTKESAWKRFGIALSLFAGILLFVGNIGAGLPSGLSFLSVFQRRGFGTLYWPMVFSLQAMALVYLLAKLRRLTVEEKRRTTTFVYGLAGGLSPLLLITVAEFIWPSLARLYEAPLEPFTRAVVAVGMLSIPFTTAYAVASQGVVTLKRMPALALRYSLSRSIVSSTAIVPAVALAVLLYQYRTDSLTALLVRPRILLALAVLTAVAFAGRYRARWLARVDKKFFREPLKMRSALTDLTSSLRETEDPEEIAAALRNALVKAVHPQAVDVMVSGTMGYHSLLGGSVSLPKGETLTEALLRLDTTESIPISQDWRPPQLESITGEEFTTLVDTGTRLVVPLIDARGDPLGVLLVADRQSETDFSREDLTFIEKAAQATALRLDNAQLRLDLVAATETEAGSDQLARQCLACELLWPPETPNCSCGGAVTPIPMPKQLNGKFELERRIGAGGMGVVYLARDLVLDRAVALKSLPLRSNRGAARLEEEARAIARVSHPNLALIFGAENWRGTPVLVFEYLEGGTLSDLLKEEVLRPQRVVEVGRALGDALHMVHQSGVLHRDVKPSNIGFSGGVVKLLDFGVAAILASINNQQDALEVTEIEPSQAEATGLLRTKTGRRIVGTPLYLSPEALRGNVELATNDLWALAIVLFESLTGHHPFRAPTLPTTFANIQKGKRLPLPRKFREGAWDTFFDRTLAKDLKGRPSSCTEFLAELTFLAL